MTDLKQAIDTVISVLVSKDTPGTGHCGCLASVKRGQPAMSEIKGMIRALSEIANNPCADTDGNAVIAKAALSQPHMEDGYALVPMEPTPAMVEAAFKAIRMWNKGTKDCVKLWEPRAGKRHPHEPGIVTELRAAIAAGKIAKLPAKVDVEKVARAIWEQRRRFSKEDRGIELEPFETPWGDKNIAEANGVYGEAIAAINAINGVKQ